MLHFGGCRLDDRTRLLTCRGEERHLSNKAFELLLLLLRGRPNVVTKQDVMAKVWPDTYVSENNIAGLVGEIRTATGDAAREPWLIRTHSGIGYSVIAPVTEVARDAPLPSGPLAVVIVGGRKVVLGDGEAIIGRDPACDVHVPHPSVSRRHARLVIAGATARVQDLGSKNGTTLGDARIEHATLVPKGARLLLGSVEMSIDFVDDLSETMSVEL